MLAFQNVDAAGAPHPNGKHLVSAVPKDAAGDRLILQIPITHPTSRGGGGGARPYAYPEHVSGNKKCARRDGASAWGHLLATRPDDKELAHFLPSFLTYSPGRASMRSCTATRSRRVRTRG